MRFQQRPVPFYLRLALIFGLAFGLRVAVADVFEGLSSPPSSSALPDQIEYESLAFQLSRGAGYTTPDGIPTAHRPPGTSLTLLPVYVVAGRSFAVGRLWFCLLSALTCLAAAWLASQCYGSLVGLVSAFWLAIYPGHFYYTLHFVSEVPYSLWLTLACGFSVRAFKSEKILTPFDVLAGGCWGLAVLTRPQIVLALPIAGVLVLMTQCAKRQALSHLALVTGVMCVVLVPWVVRNAVVMGKPTLSTVGGDTFWGANNETVLNDPQLRGSWVATSDLVDARHPLTGAEIQRETDAWRYGFEFIAQNLESLPSLMVMKVWRLLSPFEMTSNSVVLWSFAAAWLITVPWVIVGLILTTKDNSICSGILIIPLLATLGTSVVFYGSVRFRDSVIPLLLIQAARGAVWGVSALRVRTAW